jgi:hypothetical protein
LPTPPSTFTPGALIENQLLGVNDHAIAVGFYNDAAGNSHGYLQHPQRPVLIRHQ